MRRVSLIKNRRENSSDTTKRCKEIGSGDDENNAETQSRVAAYIGRCALGWL
jgi:hypothetical protein